MSEQRRRPKGTGTIQRRENGRWRGTVIVDGKRWWVYAETPEQCEEDLLRLRAGLKPRKRKKKVGLCRKKLHLRTPDNLYVDTRGARTCLACYRAAREARKQRKIASDPLSRLVALADSGARSHFTSENVREYQRRGVETKRRKRAEMGEPPLTRVCRKCSVEKPFDQFTASKACRWGRQFICKACHSQAGMEYARRNAARRKEYLREYRKANRDKEHVAQERWRRQNPERAAKLRAEKYERFKNDPGRWGRHMEYSRRYAAARRAGEKHPAEAVLAGLLDDAVRSVAEEIREIVRQDLAMRIQLRQIARIDLLGKRDVIRVSVRNAWKEMPDRFATISLDKPISEDGDLTLADLIAETAA